MIDPVELLLEAVAIPSVSGAEAQVAGYLVERMSTFAPRTFVDEAGNAVAELGDGDTQVTFLGHIDTVAGEVPARLAGGRVYGRGSVDAKGPFCAAVAAASTLADEARARLSLRLIGAVGEESPGSPGARHALSAYPCPHLLIIGEPSGWEGITIGYKGRLVLHLEVGKDSYHSAREEPTAAEEVVAAWSAARDWAATLNVRSERLFDRVQASLQSISSGDDGLRQWCSAVVGFRLPPDVPAQRARAELAARLPGSVRFEFGSAEEPVLADRDSPLTRAFRTAIRGEGGRPRLKLKTGTSDMNVVAPHWRVPTVAYGPGDSSLDHTPSEHVETAELLRATAVLREVLHRVAGT